MVDVTHKSDPDTFSVRDTQAVKGAAILLMIWHHLFGFPQYFPYETLLPVNLAFYVGQFGKICVGIYLFLSGYGMTLSARREAGSLWPVTLRRLRHFYISYWLYLAICAPYGLFVLQSGRFSPDVGLFLKNVVGYIDYNNGYDVAWWFVSIYIPLLLLFPLLHRIALRDPLMLAALALGAVGLTSRMWTGALPGSLFLWQASFIMGMLFARLDLFHSRPALEMAAKGWWWHLAVLGTLFLYRFRAGGDCTTDFIIAPVASFSLACLIRKCRVQGIFVFLGVLSLPIWLTHGSLCFSYGREFIYAPKYPPGIFALLLAVNVPLVWLIESFRRWADSVIIFRRRAAN